MVDGLLEAAEDPNFVIDMATYGELRSSSQCAGCAAATALTKLSGVPLPSVNDASTVRRDRVAHENHICRTDVWRFESAVNAARSGYPVPLFEFFEISYPDAWEVVAGFCLSTDDWRDLLPAVEELIKRYEEAGV